MAVVFRCQLFLFFFHSLCFWKSSIAINLDARFSVIKKGDSNSYFGYSVAQHQIVDEDNRKDILKNVLLIGSPKRTPTGGAIFQCDASNADEDCTEITAGLRSASDQDDQWLGVAVASHGTGKKTVACAHRFLKDNKALGSCVVYTQDLASVRFTFRPCEKLPNKNFMKDFGLCQAGMSVAMGQEESLVMGAPGSVFWQGAVFLTNVTDELGISQAEIESPYASALQVSGNQQPTPTDAYTYQGYAVAMGRFDSSKKLYYASGAPKENNKGSVVFFHKVISKPQNILRYEKNQIILGPVAFSGFGTSLLALDLNNDGFDDLIVGAPYYYARYTGGAFYVYLGGKEMTNPTEVFSRKLGEVECKELGCEHARFGISLSKIGDINMDTYQDFAVGAPYEGNGAVYIYHGDKGEPGFKTQYVQRITASDLPEAFSNIRSFGHSVSGGMDLDANGYPDLLVGAYESDTVALIRTRPIIRINPRIDISPKLIKLDSALECNLKGVKPEYKNRMCVQVEICLNFTDKLEGSIQLIPNVVYSLEAEKSRLVARVELQDATDVNKKVVLGKTLTLSKTKDVCATEIALIKSNFDDKLNPIDFTFTFHLSTDKEEPNPYPTSATQDINAFPILDIEGSTADSASDLGVLLVIEKECGDDQQCNSNLLFESTLKDLTKEGDNYELMIKDVNEIFVTFDVENKGEAAYLTRIFIQKPPRVSYLGTTKKDQSSVTCGALTEDPTMIVCEQVGNPLRSDQSVSFEVQLDVPKELAESLDLYNITTWVNTSSTETTPDEDEKVLFFRVINKAEIALSTYVMPDNSIMCQGEPRGASAIKDEEDIGAAVEHNFAVRNFGPGVISESYITIFWPYEVAGGSGKEGKYLLYLMRKPKVSGPVVQCNDLEIEQYINPLGIQEVEGVERNSSLASSVISYGAFPESNSVSGRSSRLRRDAEAPQPLRERARVVIMSCMDGSAKCFEYRCKLGKMEEDSDTVQITMEARLWESTLLSDYRKAADVQIISWGNITLPKNSKIQQDTSNDLKRAITRAVPDFKETSGQKIQWWIILVAVIVGIFVLFIVILILYKVGFFRRKRPEEMKMYKAEKKQQAMLTDIDEDNL